MYTNKVKKCVIYILYIPINSNTTNTKTSNEKRNLEKGEK